MTKFQIAVIGLGQLGRACAEALIDDSELGPADAVLGVARELLQARIPIVECACLEGRALEWHYSKLGEAADNHHVAAVVGAGWDPGVLPLLRSTFEMLIPRGHTVFHRHPGLRRGGHRYAVGL